MLVQTIREWSRDFPEASMQALRGISPVSTLHSWLEPRWFPMRDPDRSRWVLYECVHESLIPADEWDIVTMLGGCPPSRMRDPNRRAVRSQFVDDWQCEMYRTHRVWARPCWVIQGPAGGHAVVYAEAEQQLLQLKGLPTDPPAVGDLPYADFDQRTVRQLIARNRLIQLGNDLAALKRSGSPEAIQASRDAALRTYRADYLAHLEAQMAPCVDFLAWYTSSAKTATECRETLPETTREQANAAARTMDRYVETGEIAA